MLAAGAFGLGSADAGFARAATAGGWDGHDDLGNMNRGWVVRVLLINGLKWCWRVFGGLSWLRFEVGGRGRERNLYVKGRVIDKAGL